MDLYTPIWLEKTYIHHICADIECRLEDLTGATIDGDKCRDPDVEIHAVGMPWWEWQPELISKFY